MVIAERKSCITIENKKEMFTSYIVTKNRKRKCEKVAHIKSTLCHFFFLLLFKMNKIPRQFFF